MKKLTDGRRRMDDVRQVMAIPHMAFGPGEQKTMDDLNSKKISLPQKNQHRF